MSKALQLIIISVLLFACKKEQPIEIHPQVTEDIHPQVTDEFTFEYAENIQDRNITNLSNHKVDLLYNGVEKYLGGKKIKNITFQTEWLPGEQIQIVEEGLLFANRILIGKDKIRYFKDDVENVSENIDVFNDQRERANPERAFQNSHVKINYQGVSCNDSDFNKVQIKFNSSVVEIDSILNASVFEYDIDSNGFPEHYIIGSRNCSQEVVILRIIEKPSR